MNLDCPACGSGNTQKKSIAYSSGMTTSEGITHTRKRNDLLNHATHSHTTVTTNQTDLSRSASPPESKSVFAPIKYGSLSALIAPYIIKLFLPSGTVWKTMNASLMFIIFGFGLYLAYKNYIYNRVVWSASMEEWQKQYLCLRCGAEFESTPIGDCK